MINSAYNEVQFWDGRAPSLEEQAKGPIANPVEMATTHDAVVAHLQADPNYVALFKQAWGTDHITIDLVVKSIASFERTVLCGNSAFDRFYYGHEKTALTASAQRGLKLFMDPKKGNCAVCHTIGEKYALFTDNKFHNLGVGADIEGKLNDLGRYDQTKNDADYGAFKTPTLRNIAQRAPYFHDGSFPTLKDAMGHYVGGGNANAHLDKEMHALDFLSFDERDDILAFLNSLTAKMPANLGPPAGAGEVGEVNGAKPLVGCQRSNLERPRALQFFVCELAASQFFGQVQFLLIKRRRFKWVVAVGAMSSYFSTLYPLLALRGQLPCSWRRHARAETAPVHPC